MKRFAAILFAVLCVNLYTSAQTNLKGKLYIQSSIVGGLRLRWLYLGSDGTFVRDPKNGADPVNYQAEKQANPANTGKYTVAGNKINVTYDNGKSESWDVAYQGSKLNTIDGLFSSEIKAMPANYKLTGDFSSSTFAFNVGRIQTYTFKNDGTFGLKSMGAVRNDEAGATASKAGSGTYTISGNTLHLNFNDGKKATAVVGIWGMGATAYMVINNDFFEQKK